MEATAVNSDENTNNVSFESNKQEEATGAMGATSSKTCEVSGVILSQGCYVLPRCMETFVGSVTHLFSSFFHFFTSTFGRYFWTGDAYPEVNSLHSDKANEIMQKLAQQTQRDFSYKLDLRENSAWTSTHHPVGGVETNAGMLEKIEFYLKNKEALGLKGYTDQETGEFISYETLTINDVIAAMLATEMARSELSHFGRWMEVSFLVAIIAKLTGINATQTLNSLAYLYYSRIQTYEADKAGTALAAKAGYNPAAILFLNEIQDKYRPYITKALAKIYLAPPSCQERQAAAFPVVRDWKIISKA